jgi:uncharacterized BrkB/YihY/UPF0761 family membrane protein
MPRFKHLVRNTHSAVLDKQTLALAAGLSYYFVMSLFPLLILLAFGTGILLVLGVFVMFLGPQFGAWLAGKLGAGFLFARLWPVLRWTASVAFIVLGVELIFFWAPNIRQRFLVSLPGAVIAAVFWIVASYAMGLYFQNFAHFNKTYGTLGAAVALMVWLYWSWFIVLLGAQINLQLLKEKNYELPLKQPRRVPAQMPPSEQRKVRDRGAA